MALTSGYTLLAPTWETLGRRYDEFAAELHLLKEAVNRKAEGSVVDDIQLRLNGLADIVEQKAEFCEVEQVNSHLQKLNGVIATKADSCRLDEAQAQLDALEGHIKLKVDLAKIDYLESKIAALEKELKEKALFNEVETIHGDMQAVKMILATKVPVDVFEQEQAKSRELATAIAGLREMKCDAALMENINNQYRAVNTALAQKAEFNEVTQIKAQLQKMTSVTLPKNQADTIEHLTKQVQSLSNTIATWPTSPTYHHPDLLLVQKRLDELNETMSRKADASAVSEFSTQMQAQYNALSGYVANRSWRARSPNSSIPRSPATVTVTAPPVSNPWSSPPLLGHLRPRSAGRNRLNQT